MAHGRPRDPDKEPFWRDTRARWRDSGLSIRAHCRRHHLTDAQFRAWRRHTNGSLTRLSHKNVF
jgi:hypothetical protein